MHNNLTTITDRPIRIALTGCGRISGKHFEAIGQHSDDLQLVGVCDTDGAALAAAMEHTGAEGYPSVEELLKSSDADCVVLCTPSGLHSAHAIQIAQSGRHVITEKPMATRWRDGLQMVRACDDSQVLLLVVKQNRYNGTLQLLKNAIRGDRFGRIFMATINVFWCRPQEYYDSAAWRGTWEFDGGALMNQASHFVDLADWLIGPVDSVQAYMGTLARNIQVEDTAVVSLRWRSGALGTINVTMLTYNKNMEGSITILGENGSVRIGGMAANEIQHWEFADERPEDAPVRDASYETPNVYGHGHSLYYDNVVRTLRGECEPGTDGREGLRSLELLIASYLSARDAKRVALPLEY